MVGPQQGLAPLWSYGGGRAGRGGGRQARWPRRYFGPRDLTAPRAFTDCVQPQLCHVLRGSNRTYNFTCTLHHSHVAAPFTCSTTGVLSSWFSKTTRQHVSGCSELLTHVGQTQHLQLTHALFSA